jgi:hypothetical protein
LDTKKWQTIETKVELQGLQRPDACLYPGFVSTDYKPKEVEQCLLMTGTAWQSTPCKREDGISAICEYGKSFHGKQYHAEKMWCLNILSVELVKQNTSTNELFLWPV